MALRNAVNGGCNGGLSGALMSVSKSFKWLVYDSHIYQDKTYELKKTNGRFALYS